MGLDLVPEVIETTFDTLEMLATAESADSALAMASACLTKFGFSAFILARLPSRQVQSEPQILVNGWPEGWSKRYLEAGHYAYDPVAAFCADSRSTFCWTDIPDEYLVRPESRRVAEEAAEFHLNAGYCVPMHSPLGAGGMSLAGASIDPMPGVGRIASMLAFGVAEAFERIELSCIGRRRLTARERDVLTWVAYGRTVSEIASAVAISDHTVAEHLKNIRAKLGTSNNAHSLVRALLTGQLRL